MMNSMDKINQSNVMWNWMFSLDWEVRKVLNTTPKDPSPLRVRMETKRTHCDLLGRMIKIKRVKGKGMWSSNLLPFHRQRCRGQLPHLLKAFWLKRDNIMIPGSVWIKAPVLSLQHFPGSLEQTNLPGSTSEAITKISIFGWNDLCAKALWIFWRQWAMSNQGFHCHTILSLWNVIFLDRS